MANPLAIDYGPTPQEQMAALSVQQTRAELQHAQAGEAQKKQILQMQDAQKNQMEINRMKGFQDALYNAAAQRGVSSASVPLANDVPGTLDFMSNLAINNPYPDPTMAADLASKAATIRQKSAQAEYERMNTFKAQGEVQKKRLDTVVQLTDTVNDQPSLDRANAIIMATTGRPSPYAGMEYKDAAPLLAQMRDSALTQKEKIDESMKQKEYERKKKADEDRERDRAFRRAQAEALLPLKEAEMKRKGKFGGKNIGESTKDNIDRTTMEIMARAKEVGVDMDVTEAATKGRAVEAKVKSIMLAHPGVDADTARAQALSQLNLKPGITYQDGTKPTAPLPPPTDGSFEVGKYYRSKVGVVQIGKKADGSLYAIPYQADPSAGLAEDRDPVEQDAVDADATDAE